jgi:hypothetical protein
LGAGHWLVPNASKINSGKLDNDIGSIIRFTGQAPQLIEGVGAIPAVYEHLDVLYHKAFEITGISELSAQSEKPPGLNSGKALSTYANIETERFSVASKSLFQFMLEVARQTIDRARECAAVDPDFEVRAHSQQVMRTVRYLDVDLRDEDRVLKMYPTNLLTNDPAERIGQLQELAGFFPPDAIRRMMNYPDIQSENDYADASYNLIQEIIASFKELAREPDYIGPEPYMDLQDGIKRMQLAYLVAKKNKLPEERLQLFRDWIQDASAILNPALQSTPGSTPVGGPATMGAPPPVSTTGPAPAVLPQNATPLMNGVPPPMQGPLPPVQ